MNNHGLIVGYCNNRAFLYSLSSHSFSFFHDPHGPALPFAIKR